MAKLMWRTTAIGLLACAGLALAGCEGPPQEDNPPPPAATATPDPAPASPDLAGGPPASTPAPQPGAVSETATMAPIANPEDMSPDERQRIYGHRFDHVGVTAAGWRGHGHTRPHGVLAMAAPAPHHRVHARLAAAVVAAKTAAPKIVAPPKSGPAQAAATAASVSDRMLQLQSNLAGPVAQTTTLTVSDDLAAGKPGTVSLALPPTLLGLIRTEAGKLDLAKAASKIDIHASLSGEGYGIAPSGQQTAHPKLDQPLTFTWQVQPTAGAASGLVKTEVTAELIGAGVTHDVPLLVTTKSVKPAPVVAAATAAADTTGQSGLEKLNAQLGSVSLPGIGNVAVAFLAAIGVLILVGLALVVAARRSAERERERRRRARAVAAARFDEQVEAVRASGPFAHTPPTAASVAEAEAEAKVHEPV